MNIKVQLTPNCFFAKIHFLVPLIIIAKKLSRLIKSRDFYERLKFEFRVPRPRKWRSGSGKLVTSRREPRERDFPARFHKCKNFLENLSFYTSSLALKFLHKEICFVAIQVLSVAATRKILRFVLFEIMTLRSKTGSSRQMTQTAMKASRRNGKCI